MNNNMVNLIYREKTINGLNKKIKLLGINAKYNAYTFMTLRIITSIFLFIMILFLNDFGYILAPILTYLYYVFLPNLYFNTKIKKRGRVLDYQAMYFFEILALSIESGNNLIKAIKTTSNSIDNELALEFREVIREVEMGKSLDEALTLLKERIPSDTINNIILNIRESNLFGNNIIDSLNNQIDYLRDKKLLNIKGKINKMPVKISVISVIFIIPIVLLLILGPVVINLLLNS